MRSRADLGDLQPFVHKYSDAEIILSKLTSTFLADNAMRRVNTISDWLNYCFFIKNKVNCSYINIYN